MNFFLEKQLIKLPCTYWPLSFCKILKIFLGPVQSYEDVPFLGLKWLICHEQNFFGTNRYYFHLPIGPFHCAKFKKILTADPVMSMHHFWAQHGPFARNNFFFSKIINITLIYLLAPFVVQNIKQILTADPELWICAMFGPKMAHFPKWELKKTKKPVNESCFFCSCLSTSQKSKSDKSHWLRAIFNYNLRTRLFQGMQFS